MLSAMQVEQGLKMGEATYLATLIEMKVDQWVEVLNLVSDVLIEYVDVMPPELPKALPPKCATNHSIELQRGAKPPSKGPLQNGIAQVGRIEEIIGRVARCRFDSSIQGTI